ncbi:MAG: hypothetical protein ABSC48_05615 [Terracidiphilus sp.]|jgi:photosystem II stability/assembly factor-like uncharacterized protein
MRIFRLIPLLTFSAFAAAQSPAPPQAPWQMQDSGTTAGLRGIDSVDGTVAWASGTGGTVLRTTDGGAQWTKCAIPDAASDGATLDFRGVQAWDATTAIVMASGPGEKSRLYKTKDGCISWRLVFTNPDKRGFWDAIQFDGKQDGMLLGDPVGGRFAVFITQNGGERWIKQRPNGLKADASKESIFAASNSSLIVFTLLAHRYFVSGGTGGARFIECHGELEVGGRPENVGCLQAPSQLPLAMGTTSSGAFSMGFGSGGGVIVGGDYAKSNDRTGTAAWSADGGDSWTASTTPPHGFRSAVQWSETLQLWITVGTNGSDISRDDGKTWQPLDDGNWNALSLPFVVGPNGRIARLNPAAVPAGK